MKTIAAVALAAPGEAGEWNFTCENSRSRSIWAGGPWLLMVWMLLPTFPSRSIPALENLHSPTPAHPCFGTNEQACCPLICRCRPHPARGAVSRAVCVRHHAAAGPGGADGLIQCGSAWQHREGHTAGGGAVTSQKCAWLGASSVRAWCSCCCCACVFHPCWFTDQMHCTCTSKYQAVR
jgi:hypothetical protein